MQVFNNYSKYGLFAKLFHWITFIALLAQVPFGFYLVGLEFSDQRIELENIHILVGITVFYITLFRLIWKLFNPSSIWFLFSWIRIFGSKNRIRKHSYNNRYNYFLYNRVQTYLEII